MRALGEDLCKIIGKIQTGGTLIYFTSKKNLILFRECWKSLFSTAKNKIYSDLDKDFKLENFKKDCKK